MANVSSVTKHFITGQEGFTTTLASTISSGATTVPLNSVTGYSNGDQVAFVIEPTDETKKQVFTGTIDTSGVQVTGVVWTEGTNQTHNAGVTVVDYWTATHQAAMVKGLKVEHNDDGTHDETLITSRTEDTSPDPDADFVLTYDTSATTLKKVRPNNLSLYAPQGFLQNGYISRTVASNNITVAIKTLAGADPSTTDPVYVRIGNTIRSITSALSVTKNAGTNWFSSGSSETAAVAVEYFVYLGYNATDGVVIGFARIPFGRTYTSFSTTTTNDRYCAISTITNAVSTDEYELVGRFNATLSATASFNWSIPAADIVVSRPVFETRWLTWTPTWAGSGSNPAIGNGTLTATYKITGQTLEYRFKFVAGSTTTFGSGNYTLTMPIGLYTSVAANDGISLSGYSEDSGVKAYIVSGMRALTTATTFSPYFVDPASATNPNWGATTPFTWANGDYWSGNGSIGI